MSDPKRLKPPAEEAVQLAVRYAEEIGMLAIPQFFALTTYTDDAGKEWAHPLGPLRMVPANAARDGEAIEGRPITIAHIIRFSDPADPDQAQDYARLKREQLDEMEALERDK